MQEAPWASTRKPIGGDKMWSCRCAFVIGNGWIDNRPFGARSCDFVRSLSIRCAPGPWIILSGLCWQPSYWANRMKWISPYPQLITQPELFMSSPFRACTSRSFIWSSLFYSKGLLPVNAGVGFVSPCPCYCCGFTQESPGFHHLLCGVPVCAPCLSYQKNCNGQKMGSIVCVPLRSSCSPGIH